MIIQNVAPGPPRLIADRDTGDVAEADGARHGRGEGLEVGHLPDLVGAGVLALHEPDGVCEAAQVDEAVVDREDDRGQCEPRDDEREGRAGDRHRVEDDVLHGGGHLGEGVVDDPVETAFGGEQQIHHGTTVTGTMAIWTPASLPSTPTTTVPACTCSTTRTSEDGDADQRRTAALGCSGSARASLVAPRGSRRRAGEVASPLDPVNGAPATAQVGRAGSMTDAGPPRELSSSGRDDAGPDVTKTRRCTRRCPAARSTGPFAHDRPG